jgi:hypothetical protein
MCPLSNYAIRRVLLLGHHLNRSSTVLPSSVHRLSGRATWRLLAQEISHAWATATPQSCRPSFRPGELDDRRLAILPEVGRSRICLLVASAPGVDASLCFSSPLLYRFCVQLASAMTYKEVFMHECDRPKSIAKFPFSSQVQGVL